MNNYIVKITTNAGESTYIFTVRIKREIFNSLKLIFPRRINTIEKVEINKLRIPGFGFSRI